MILDFIIRTRADGNAGQEAAKALGGVEKAATGAAQGAAKAGTEVKHASKELKEFAKIGHEAEGVMIGLERGGMSGLAMAGRNLAGIFKTLATGSVGAVLIPAIIGVTALLKVMETIADHAGEAVNKMFEEMAANSEKRKQTLEADSKAIEKAFDEERKNLKGLIEEYDALTAAIDRADSRRKQLAAAKREGDDARTELSKQGELDAAKTPEQKAAIEAKYAGQKTIRDRDRKKLDLDNDDSANELRTREQQNTIDSARASKNKASKEVSRLENNAFDANKKLDLMAAVDNKLGTSESAAARASAAKEAETAAESVRSAQKRFLVQAADADKIIAAAAAKIAEMATSKEVNEVKRQNLVPITKLEVNKQTAESKEKIAGLAKDAVEAQAVGDFSGQDKAVSGIKGLLAAANALRKAVGEQGITVADALKQTAKEAEKNSKKIKLQTQAGAGGGN